MFEQARRLGVVQRNPLVDVDKPKRSKSDDRKGRPLTHDEFWRTHAELVEGGEAACIAPLFLFAQAQGLRLKEATVLGWDGIDQTQGFVTICSDNKTGCSRMVPLGEVGAEVLGSLPEVRHVSGRVFLDENGQPLDGVRGRNRVSQRVAAAMRRSGVFSTAEGRASFKAVRTTLATVLAENGHSLYLIAELLGHAWAKDNVTGRHYARVRTKELRPLVETFDNWLRDGHIQDTFGTGAASNARDSRQPTDSKAQASSSAG